MAYYEKQENPALTNELNEEITQMFKASNKVEQIHEETETDIKIVDEFTKKWDLNDKIIALFANKREDDEKLKRHYAVWLIIILVVQLICLNTWFVLKGCGVFSIDDTTFNIFITGGILEVFVLVKIIVTYLFKDDLSDLLKILVETNNSGNNKETRSHIERQTRMEINDEE